MYMSSKKRYEYPASRESSAYRRKFISELAIVRFSPLDLGADKWQRQQSKNWKDLVLYSASFTRINLLYHVRGTMYASKVQSLLFHPTKYTSTHSEGNKVRSCALPQQTLAVADSLISTCQLPCNAVQKP